MICIKIPLNPVTKKNSQRILYRWQINKAGRRVRVPFIAPSAAYKQYEHDALFFLPGMPDIDYPVNVKCVFYMQTKHKVDLNNLLEGCTDLLVKGHVLQDDNSNIVKGHDGSRVMFDKANPRTEIYIERWQE